MYIVGRASTSGAAAAVDPVAGVAPAAGVDPAAGAWIGAACPSEPSAEMHNHTKLRFTLTRETAGRSVREGGNIDVSKQVDWRDRLTARS